jgi:RNA polymerase sigma-70 factor (ECF subfamily)
MDGSARSLVGPIVGVDADLEREFEFRLAESSTLTFRVAYAVLRNRADAEEVAQEAFVRAHRRFAQLRDRERFRSWLVRIAWRLALDRQRADRRRKTREDAHVARSRLGTSTVDPRVEALWNAVDLLPEKLRMVIVLANVEGHDVHEIAELLRLPEGTVKSRLFLARQRLKDQLT